MIGKLKKIIQDLVAREGHELADHHGVHADHEEGKGGHKKQVSIKRRQIIQEAWNSNQFTTSSSILSFSFTRGSSMKRRRWRRRWRWRRRGGLLDGQAKAKERLVGGGWGGRCARQGREGRCGEGWQGWVRVEPTTWCLLVRVEQKRRRGTWRPTRHRRRRRKKEKSKEEKSGLHLFFTLVPFLFFFTFTPLHLCTFAPLHLFSARVLSTWPPPKLSGENIIVSRETQGPAWLIDSSYRNQGIFWRFISDNRIPHSTPHPFMPLSNTTCNASLVTCDLIWQHLAEKRKEQTKTKLKEVNSAHRKKKTHSVDQGATQKIKKEKSQKKGESDFVDSTRF